MKKTTLLLLILPLFACTDKEEKQVNHQEKIQYQSAVFEPSEQHKTHKISGFVVPTNQASLSFQVSGIIDQQLIKIGDNVELNQALFKITNPALEPQIQQFKSQIKAVEATLSQNTAEVKRIENLIKTNAVSQNELDRLTNQRNNLQATKKSIEAQLEQAQSMFDETYLRAPFAGNVAEIYKETGEVISPGELIMVLGGVSSLEAPLYLPAFLHKHIQLGQKLPISYLNYNWQATVKEISLTANPKSQLFKVLIEIPIKHGLKSGEKVTVIIKENLGHFYRLPIESVIDDGINEPFVFLIDNKQVIQTKIDLITIDDNDVIVKMPHQTNIEVVTQGQVNLSPNQKLSKP